MNHFNDDDEYPQLPSGEDMQLFTKPYDVKVQSMARDKIQVSIDLKDLSSIFPSMQWLIFLANGIAVCQDQKILISTDKGLLLLKLRELEHMHHKAKLAEMRGEIFSSVIGQASGKVLGVCRNPMSKNVGHLFQAQVYEECLSFKQDFERQIYMEMSQSKLVTSMNSVSYQVSFNTVQILCNPFGSSFSREINFTFDFMIQDFTPIGCDKCVAISRDGWVGVFYEDSEFQVIPSNNFQLELDDQEYADCIVADSARRLICISTSKNGVSRKLIFCEVIGDQEIFLIQSSTFYFSQSTICESLKSFSKISCELSFCNETTLVLFESGANGGIFVLTSAEGGYDIQEKNYLKDVFEQGFVDLECKSLNEIWTLDKSGEVRLITKLTLLGTSNVFVNNSPIISDEEFREEQIGEIATRNQEENLNTEELDYYRSDVQDPLDGINQDHEQVQQVQPKQSVFKTMKSTILSEEEEKEKSEKKYQDYDQDDLFSD